jgi:LysM repeat protein
MDPSHPDFFRRADPFDQRVLRRRGERGQGRGGGGASATLRWLLPLAAAIPLVIAVIQHRPVPKPAMATTPPGPVVNLPAPLPALQDEAVFPVQAEREKRLSPRSHLVVPGETLGGIALTYRCDLNALAAANGIDPDGKLLAGTILLLPRPGAVSKPQVVASAPVPPKGPDVVLTPVAPDWTPPSRFEAAAEATLEPAPMAEVAVPATGAQVRSSVYPSVTPEPLPSGGDQVPGVVQPVSGRTMAIATAAASGASIHYLVQPGDRWESIAAAHFTTVAVLQHINGPVALDAGQVIQVPVEQCLTQPR